MNDIERAMAQLKAKVGGGIGPAQMTSENDGRLHVDGSASGELYDADLYIGTIEFDCEPVVLNPSGTYTLPTEPVSNDSHDAPRPRKSRKRPSNTFELSRTLDLPLAELGTAGFIIPSTRKSKITEEYRRIKRPLLKRLADSSDNGETARNVIAVTSAMSGEGKTFSAINLAMSLAREKDRTVLLIDADVVRHTAGELFGVSSKDIGLLDILDNNAMELSDVILKTNVERLYFLPAGRKHAHASELLSSDNMSRLIADVSSEQDDLIVVVDCPPIMQTNEAAILVDHAGQILFVVAEEQTSQGMVIQALRLVGNEKKVGVLLNKSTTRLGHYDHYSYAYS